MKFMPKIGQIFSGLSLNIIGDSLLSSGPHIKFNSRCIIFLLSLYMNFTFFGHRSL